MKNLAMLPSYFDYIFVHLRQKVRLRPELSPKFLSTSGPNPTRKARPDLQLCLTPPLLRTVGEPAVYRPNLQNSFIFTSVFYKN